jgi:uncharacterized protein
MPRLNLEQARQLLELNNVPSNVIEHCLTVSVFAKEIAKKIKKNGHTIDIDFVESAALLHDIGRSKTHDIRHGIVGGKILSKYPRYARVCERHIGGGITKEEAAKLGLPARDYIPKTLEEKVVCYADKLVHGTKKVSLDETLEKFRMRLGKGHPAIGRIKGLDLEIRALIRKNKG